MGEGCGGSNRGGGGGLRSFPGVEGQWQCLQPLSPPYGLLPPQSLSEVLWGPQCRMIVPFDSWGIRPSAQGSVRECVLSFLLCFYYMSRRMIKGDLQLSVFSWFYPSNEWSHLQVFSSMAHALFDPPSLLVWWPVSVVCRWLSTQSQTHWLNSLVSLDFHGQTLKIMFWKPPEKMNGGSLTYLLCWLVE